MSIADACLCELCPLGERILRKQERNPVKSPSCLCFHACASRAYANI